MGFKQIRTSDLTDNELKDMEVVTVTVRTAGKKFDASIEELSGLKRMNNVVELEFCYNDPERETETVLCTQAEFDKLVPAAKLETFDSIKGRRSGYSPRG